MSELSLDRLRRDGQAFMEAISREFYLAHSGHKATAELQPLYDRYGAIMSDESLALVLEAFRAAPDGSEEQRGLRLLLDWQAESQASRELAALDEREIAWEAEAMLTLPDGSRVPFQRAAIDMANSTDRAHRLSLEAARARLVEAELAPLRMEHFQREREITERLGLARGYNATFDLLSGVPLMDLRGQCEQFLRDTQHIWDEVYPEFVKRELGIAPGDATRADALALMRGRQYDAAFPWEAMQPQILGQVRESGISPDADGRITFDTGEREGKRSRAFCSPVRVPDEVYLVLRPHGGQADWSTFLHELGHALHFAYMAPDLAFEYRWLGDNSVTEGYAMLFDHRLHDARWLARYTQLGTADIARFLRSAGFEELQFLRRYCAKLIYETQLYGGDVAWSALPDLYVQLLTGATTFRYSRADAFVDVDPRYYAARYLRAWQLQSVLAESLTERFDEDWWRNPRCGPWMVEHLFGHGQRELAHEQAQRVAGRTLGFAPLVRAIERMLG
ncbi:MAG TPA: hypothetical protein VG818_10460 [Gemmatimonadaceae bacterium]|nr:hypothetical protein [Gemmatimonadaceae bacterium]